MLLVLLIAMIASINPAAVWGLDKIRIGMGAFSPTNSAVWVRQLPHHPQKMRMNADQAKYAERTYDQYANLYYERVPYPSPTGIKTVLESLAKDNPKAKGADPSSFVDASIFKSLEDSGFMKSLYD